MEKERFVETGKNSLFGDYIYEQIVPQCSASEFIGQHGGLE